MNCLWVVITHVQQPAKQLFLAGTTANIYVKSAALKQTVSLLKRNMEFAVTRVEDHTQPAVITAKLHVMVTFHVHFAWNLVKSVATTPNAASYVMSLVYHVLKIVPGRVHIGDGVRYHVLYLVICFHAQSAVKSC